MRRLLFLFVVAFVFTADAADSTNRLHFPVNGFSIKPLEADPGTLAPQPLIMALPLEDKFAANVNVGIQSYTGTLDQYVALSEKQFKEATFEVIQKRKLDSSTVVFEYTGEIQGRKLHWYSRAVRSAGSIYLVTATSLEKNWRRDAATLKACVDSFQRENTVPSSR